MKFYLRNFRHVPQLQIHILCLQQWFNHINENTANRLIDNKHKYEYTHA